MRRISSRSTFVYKGIFPLLLFGIVSLFIAFVILGPLRSGQSPPLPVLIVRGLAAAFIYFVMKKLIFDLVDEVLDAGDALIVRNRGQEDRIAFSDIVDVNYTPRVSPPRVTLSLRRASVFGAEVTFLRADTICAVFLESGHQRVDSKDRCRAPAL